MASLTLKYLVVASLSLATRVEHGRSASSDQVGNDKIVVTIHNALTYWDHSKSVSSLEKTVDEKPVEKHRLLQRDYSVGKPTSFIDLVKVTPNPYARLHLMYCMGDPICGDRSKMVKVCPGTTMAGGKEMYTLLANPYSTECQNPDWNVLDKWWEEGSAARKRYSHGSTDATECSMKKQPIWGAVTMNAPGMEGETEKVSQCFAQHWRQSAKTDAMKSYIDKSFGYTPTPACNVQDSSSLCDVVHLLATALHPGLQDESNHSCYCSFCISAHDWVREGLLHAHKVCKEKLTRFWTTCSVCGELYQASFSIENRNDTDARVAGAAFVAGSATIKEAEVNPTGGLVFGQLSDGRVDAREHAASEVDDWMAWDKVPTGTETAQNTADAGTNSTLAGEAAGGGVPELSRDPPPKDFPGFQMFGISIVQNCGIRMSLYSQSFPMPAARDYQQMEPDNLKQTFENGGIFNQGGLVEPNLADAGVIPPSDPILVKTMAHDVEMIFATVTELEGNVMMNTKTRDIGDARGTRTKVFPSHEDEGFYFVFEPNLANKNAWRIRYECTPQKRNALAKELDFVASHSGGAGAYSQEDRQYYEQMAELCSNDYYWCVKADALTQMTKFYACNNNGLRATFQLDFKYIDLPAIYGEKEELSETQETQNCAALFSKNRNPEDSGKESPYEAFRVGDEYKTESTIARFFRKQIAPRRGLLLVAFFFIIICIKYGGSTRDELDLLKKRRKFWLSEPGYHGGVPLNQERERFMLHKSDPDRVGEHEKLIYDKNDVKQDESYLAHHHFKSESQE